MRLLLDNARRFRPNSACCPDTTHAASTPRVAEPDGDGAESAGFRNCLLLTVLCEVSAGGLPFRHIGCLLPRTDLRGSRFIIDRSTIPFFRTLSGCSNNQRGTGTVQARSPFPIVHSRLLCFLTRFTSVQDSSRSPQDTSRGRSWFRQLSSARRWIGMPCAPRFAGSASLHSWIRPAD